MQDANLRPPFPVFLIAKVSRARKEYGFSLIEIVTVTAIIAVLAAITVPLALSQRKKGVDTAMQTELVNAAAKIDHALEGWRGTPPGTIQLSWNAPTWQLTDTSVTPNVTVASGQIASGSTISGTVWSDGSYCVAAVNSSGSATLNIRSDTDTITTGPCPGSALGGTGTAPTGSAASTLAAPTNLSASSTSVNMVSATWTAVAGASSYLVSVTGLATTETTTASATIANAPAGVLTVTVRAKNGTTVGPASAATVTVTGSAATTTIIDTNDEIRGNSQFRILGSNSTQRSLIIRNDGTATYLVYSAPNDQYGAMDTARPFTIQNLTGNVGFGTAPVTGVNMLVGKKITDAAYADNAQFFTYLSGTGQTVGPTSVRSIMNAASNFTLGEYTHFRARQGTIGSGSTVTNQYGYYMDAVGTPSTTPATAFRGAIAAGTNRWNLYMAGTAANWLAGDLRIGGADSSGNVSITGGTTGGTITSGTAPTINGTLTYGSLVSINQGAATGGTSAASITGTDANFAGTALTTAAGYSATTGTFSGAVSAGALTGNSTGWFSGNLGVGGTSGAPNVNFNATTGNVGLGAAASSSVNLLAQSNITGGTTADNAQFNGTVQNTVTVQAVNIRTQLSTVSQTGLTLSDVANFRAQQGTIGSGSVTNQYGYAVDGNMTGGASNYAFAGQLTNTLANRWNLYMAGNAANYLAGNLQIGGSAGTGNASITSAGVVTPGSTVTFSTSTTGGALTATTGNFGSGAITSSGALTAASGNFGSGTVTGGALTATTGTYGSGSAGFFGIGGTSSSPLTSLTMSGNLGLGQTGWTQSTSPGVMLFSQEGITGGTTATGAQFSGTVQAGVTTQAVNVRSTMNTASNFTLGNYTHFEAEQGTIGSGGGGGTPPPSTLYLSSTNSDLTGGTDFSKALSSTTGTLATQALTLTRGSVRKSYGFSAAGTPGSGARFVSDPTTWTTNTGIDTGTGYINDIVYANGYWLAAGNTLNHLRWATDPAGTWTETIGETWGSGAANTVGYGNGYWVLLASAGGIRVTTDFKHGPWATPTTSTLGGTPRAITYANGYWVAVGDSGLVAWATDPMGTWTVNTNAGANQLLDVDFNNGYWVAVGATGTVRYAADPTGVWSAATTGFTGLVTHVEYGNGYWAVSSPTEGIRYASNLAGPWTLASIGIPTSSNTGQDVVYADGYWVTTMGAGQIPTQGLAWTKDITTPWTATTNTVWAGKSLQNLAYGDGYWVTTGTVGSLYTAASTLSAKIDTRSLGANVAVAAAITRVNSSGVVQGSTPTSAYTTVSATGTTTLSIPAAGLGTFGATDRLRVDYKLAAPESASSTGAGARAYYLSSTTSDLGPSGAISNQELTSALGTAGTLSVNMPGTSGDMVMFGYTPVNIPSSGVLYGGPASYTVSVNISTGVTGTQTNMAVSLARVNATGELQTGTAWSSSQSTTTGVKIYSFSALDLGYWEPGDRLRVGYRFNNTGSTAKSITIATGNASTYVSTSLTLGGTVAYTIGYNTAESAVGLNWTGSTSGGSSSSATITNQYGYAVDANMTGGGSNYAFYSALTAATGRWNLYMAGTAANWLAGGLTIGGTAAAPNVTITTAGAITSTSAGGSLTTGTLAAGSISNRSTTTLVTNLDADLLDGLSSSTFVQTRDVQLFTSSGTWTRPAGTNKWVDVYVVGGGGAGGNGFANASTTGARGGGGGGGGGCSYARFSTGNLATSVTVTVGGGGTPATTVGAAGGAGSPSSFGNYLTATGGGGGGGGTGTTSGAGGTAGAGTHAAGTVGAGGTTGTTNATTGASAAASTVDACGGVGGGQGGAATSSSVAYAGGSGGTHSLAGTATAWDQTVNGGGNTGAPGSAGFSPVLTTATIDGYSGTGGGGGGGKPLVSTTPSTGGGVGGAGGLGSGGGGGGGGWTFTAGTIGSGGAGGSGYILVISY